MFTVTTEEMLFPIDVFWISSAMNVTDVAHNVQPRQLITSNRPARYFLEVNAVELGNVNISAPVTIQFTDSALQLQVDIAGTVAALLVMNLMVTMVNLL